MAGDRPSRVGSRTARPSRQATHRGRAGPSVKAPAYDLHVLLRHRLLLQPHGFEGLGPGEKGLDSGEFAFAQYGVGRELLIKLKPTGAAQHLDAPEPERRISEVAHLSLFELEYG